jgi:hypothetical protein
VLELLALESLFPADFDSDDFDFDDFDSDVLDDESELFSEEPSRRDPFALEDDRLSVL